MTRLSLTHRTMLGQGYTFTRLGGNLSCWSRAVSNTVEERVYSTEADATQAPVRLTEAVAVVRIDLLAEERDGYDFGARPTDYPSLSAFLDSRPVAERLP